MVAIVTNLCDPCRADGEEVTATMQRELSDNGKPYIVDLCDNHYKNWYAPFVEAIYNYGLPADNVPKSRAVGGTAPTSRGRGDRWHCKICKLNYELRGSLTQHEITKHPGHPDLDHAQCPVCREWKSRPGLPNHIGRKHPKHAEKIA